MMPENPEGSPVGFRLQIDNAMRISSRSRHSAVSRTIEVQAVFLAGMEFVLDQVSAICLLRVFHVPRLPCYVCIREAYSSEFNVPCCSL